MVQRGSLGHEVSFARGFLINCFYFHAMSSTSQVVTPELRQWIIEQAQSGQAPAHLLASMKASGWEEATAIQALEETLTSWLAEHQRQQVALKPTAPMPDLAKRVHHQSRLWVLDREVDVLMSMTHPRIVVLGGFLSTEECAALRSSAAPRLRRSETVINDTGGSEVNDQRTSDGMFFERGENEVCAKVEARLAALLNWPIENGEGLQVLRYGVGAEYRPHYDYFDLKQPGTPTILKRGGQRLATVVMYLNTPERGGGTSFPDIGLEVQAVQGNAVFFNYAVPEPVTKTLHGGSPVIAGEKWVATKWLRQGRFD